MSSFIIYLYIYADGERLQAFFVEGEVGVQPSGCLGFDCESQVPGQPEGWTPTGCVNLCKIEFQTDRYSWPIVAMLKLCKVTGAKDRNKIEDKFILRFLW